MDKCFPLNRSRIYSDDLLLVTSWYVHCVGVPCFVPPWRKFWLFDSEISTSWNFSYRKCLHKCIKQYAYRHRMFIVELFFHNEKLKRTSVSVKKRFKNLISWTVIIFSVLKNWPIYYYNEKLPMIYCEVRK